MSRLDAETLAGVRESLRSMFATTDSEAIEAALRDLGWDDVVAEDPASATSALFTAQGHALAESRLVEQVMLGVLRNALASTSEEARLALPPLGSAEPHAFPLASGLLLAPVAVGTPVIVPVQRDGETMLTTVDSKDLEVNAALARGFDQTAGWAVVNIDLTDQELTAVGSSWDAAVAAGRRALSAEIIGICEAALTLAVAHTSNRRQYGRPLGSFQAVRHRLAEAHAAIEAARVTLDACWARPDDATDDQDTEWAAAVAKYRAGNTQALVLRRTVQVMGAMGITFESDMHRHITRAAAVDALLGGHLTLAEELGQKLLLGATPNPLASI